MCGIAGVLYADPDRPPERSVLQAMGKQIAHRGPDADGFWIEPGIGLVHRRLSIIDLAGGNQPIANEDGSIQLVYNGEVYNFETLCKELENKGHRFRTRSDTEVLVHLYEELGDRLVERLRGMFAFSLWDRKRKQLVLARDRLGIKPLYIYQDPEKVLFASELKAIFPHPGVDRELDSSAVEDYLAFGMVPGPRTIFRHIKKLQPAHVVTLSSRDLQAKPRRYWRLKFEPDPKPTAEEWQELVREKVAESVRLHLIADVPVGAFLSGGMDSSVMVALAAGATQGPLQTFSIGFKEESFSELPYARQIARQFGTRHVEEIVTPDAVNLIDELTHYYDEPFADSSAIPTYLVSRLAARSVKVVLSGDGGDEAFGGYVRYAHDLNEAAIRRRLPSWFRRKILGPLGRGWPKADWLPRPLRAKTRVTNLALNADEAYANTLSICRRPLRRQLLGPTIAAGLNGYDPEGAIKEGHANGLAGDALTGMIAADMATILPDDFLVKVDRASMAHGLEVRPPLLDHELLELAGRIPSKLKIHKGTTKWIFKEAFRTRLPSEIVDRKKHGFEMPVDSWLRGPLRDMVEASVFDRNSAARDLIDQSVARKIYQSHLAGASRQGQVLWSLLILSRWAERYL
ncbi:MAG: asparagine synthase (glutamine-hydrolyzing) [Gemmataceae bacterium]